MTRQRNWVIGGLAVLLVVGGQWVLLRSALYAQNQVMGDRFNKMVGQILVQAHRSGDDLAMAQSMRALSKTPGILFACVIDRNRKILAHTDPAKLGSSLGAVFPYIPGDRSFGLGLAKYSGWTRTESDGKVVWGRLLVVFSNWNGRLWLRREAAFLGTSMFLAGLGVWWAGWRWNEQRRDRDRKIDALESVNADLQNQLIELEEAQEKSNKRWASYLDFAVEQIPSAMLLLNDRQRVVTANSAAARALQAADGDFLKEKSWQEIPGLTGCGAQLEQSLAHPGTPIEGIHEEGKLQFKFETIREGLVGTWISRETL